MIESNKQYQDKQGMNAAEWVQQYSNDVMGFKRWCADEDQLFVNEEMGVDWTAFQYPEDITKSFVGVPCHAGKSDVLSILLAFLLLLQT